jgi:hypothetical protein
MEQVSIGKGDITFRSLLPPTCLVYPLWVHSAGTREILRFVDFLQGVRLGGPRLVGKELSSMASLRPAVAKAVVAERSLLTS